MEAAAPPLLLWSPRRIRGRPSGLQGASHRAARDAPSARPGPPSLCDPSGKETRAGPACPTPARGHHKTSHPFNIPLEPMSPQFEGIDG